MKPDAELQALYEAKRHAALEERVQSLEWAIRELAHSGLGSARFRRIIDQRIPKRAS